MSYRDRVDAPGPKKMVALDGAVRSDPGWHSRADRSARRPHVVGVVADGTPLPVVGDDVRIPPGTSHMEITYT